jgi:hypothetical protein
LSWNLIALLSAVEKRHGVKQRDLLDPILQSIADRRYYAAYHYEQAKALLSAHLDSRDEIERLKLEFRVSNEGSGAYQLAKKQACAHIVASLQSVHSLADTLAHAIYFSLGFNIGSTKANSERDINLGWVARAVSATPGLHDVAQVLDQLRTNDEYRYLNDVVNTSKHRNIVGVGVTHYLDQSNQVPWALELQSFEREATASPHPKRPVDPFLPDEFLRQTKLIVEVGQLLNKRVQ